MRNLLQPQPQEPHVLILPFPAQGHVKPMLTLAKLLCHAGLHVTLLNTHHNHTLLKINLQALSTLFPTLHFESISDGLPADHPRTILSIPDMFSSLKSVTKPLFREFLIASNYSNPPDQDRHNRPRFTCIIADGIMSFAIDVAEEFGIPVISFRTFSASCLWCYFCVPKLIEDGELPFQDDDMDKKFTSVPGMENLLRRRDLPGICRLKDVNNNPIFQFFVNETLAMTRASSLILNTFDDLEASVLSRIAPLFPKIYTIGPLNGLLKFQIKEASPNGNGSLLNEDRDCMTWLDSQPSRSVMYVSFGSLAMMTRGQLLEILFGLVKSGKRFLWVVRSDSINGDGEEEQGMPVELEVGTKERGLMVEWAPQEEVLGHWAVGGFLTHSGWNSTMESIVAGVPMICWPQFADQQINSRWVSDVWRIGLDMKDTCDREIVEKMVRELMEHRREEMIESADRLAGLAHDTVAQGGSSYQNLEKLIEDIKFKKICNTY